MKNTDRFVVFLHEIATNEDIFVPVRIRKESLELMELIDDSYFKKDILCDFIDECEYKKLDKEDKI